jgi:hypothetical protein
MQATQANMAVSASLLMGRVVGGHQFPHACSQLLQCSTVQLLGCLAVGYASDEAPRAMHQFCTAVPTRLLSTPLTCLVGMHSTVVRRTRMDARNMLLRDLCMYLYLHLLLGL